ncbi:plasmid partition protein ParG [Lignipirellula cremea]|uniref:ParG n=1 Tax=Lignipirellula cremea TaxID=2528010 RepID=A0A518E3B1_9BACT|nr:plasmid partition protein ParG [Lignipirellula cremea]QDU98588.1 ParG [Lignipirellula cremea]
MSKRIQMQARPQAKANADKWVESREEPVIRKPHGKPKRLTIDIDRELHTRLKIHCATHGTQIVDVLRTMIEDLVAKSE